MTHNRKVSVRGMLQAGVALIIVIIISVLCLRVSSDDYKQNGKESVIQEFELPRE